MIFAFCGSAGSGVTVTSLKAAQELYEMRQEPVIYVSLDEEVPTLGLLVENKMKKEAKQRALPSLHELLERDNVSRDGILRHMYVQKDFGNMGILAFRAGENHKVCPYVVQRTAKNLIEELKALAPVIVIDCGRCQSYLSLSMWKEANKQILVVCPGAKEDIYYMQRHEYLTDMSTETKQINAAHPKEKQIWFVQKERRDQQYLSRIKKRLENQVKAKQFDLGYSGKIVGQVQSGTLLKMLGACGYKRKMRKALKEMHQ